MDFCDQSILSSIFIYLTIDIDKRLKKKTKTSLAFVHAKFECSIANISKIIRIDQELSDKSAFQTLRIVLIKTMKKLNE